MQDKLQEEVSDMKESLRRLILFAVIVITGSFMILLDVPLIIMIPFILVVGFIILVLLGAITKADLKAAIDGLKPKNLKNTVFFWKKDKSGVPEKGGTKPVTKQAKKDTKPGPEKTSGFVAHIKSFVSSIGSLKKVISDRNKQKRKAGDIDKLLDKTVSEKIPSPNTSTALGGAGGVAAASGASGAQDNQDPFLSLEGDEFDESLLDGLDDEEGEFGKAGGSDGAIPATSGELSMPSVEGEALSIPDLDAASETDTSIDDKGLGDLGELDDTGGLGELDNLSLDDLDMDLEDEEGADSTSPSAGDNLPSEPAAPAAPAPAAAPAAPLDMNKGWIESDTPQLEDQMSVQQDMASFASSSGGGSEEDLLSSIASDVKHVKKEKDLSLLRDLKDFKAPASEIEEELTGVYEKLNALKKTAAKDTQVSDGMK